MLFLHLSSCRQQGGWLMKPQFSTGVWLPSYWLSGVMNTLWSLVGFGVVLVSLCSSQPFNAFEVHAHPFMLTPPMDLVHVESRLSE